MIHFETVASEEGEVQREDRSLAEINFRNTVIHYREELRRIHAGELATDHLKDRQRKALVKAGILRRVYGRGGCRLRLSNEAWRLLEELDNSHRQLS